MHVCVHVYAGGCVSWEAGVAMHRRDWSQKRKGQTWAKSLNFFIFGLGWCGSVD